MNEFNVSEPLAVGTHSILTLGNQHSTLSQDTVCFLSCIVVQSKHCFMISACRLAA